MKVALVHDYIKEYGGAERVLETLHELYPDATVYTSVYLPSYLGPHKERFANWDIKTSWLQYLPFKAKLISPFRLLSPFIFRQFDFKGYDVIIVSATGAYIPNSIRKQKAVQICYCHTPPRYLYGYATAREWRKNAIVRLGASIVNHILRIVDYHAAAKVDVFIANSAEVAGRIQKFYRRKAEIIYPPVDTAQRKSHQVSEKKTYYLAGGRLARPKHIDLIVTMATESKLPLKVFGKAFAGYGDELKQLAGDSVTFLGEISDAEKWQLLSGAEAYIFASEDEDFGILPVEAMAVGTPVIAYRSGGVQETVLDGKTGIFFEKLTVPSLMDAIKRLQKMKIDHQVIRDHAKKFRKERFMKELSRLVTLHTTK
jgi:glycosyltransferase involved in cell wall biosynthesis